MKPIAAFRFTYQGRGMTKPATWYYRARHRAVADAYFLGRIGCAILQPVTACRTRVQDFHDDYTRQPPSGRPSAS